MDDLGYRLNQEARSALVSVQFTGQEAKLIGRLLADCRVGNQIAVDAYAKLTAAYPGAIHS